VQDSFWRTVVFRFLLNVDSDSDEVTEAGKLFHTRAAATGKARSPTVKRRVRGTVSTSEEDERVTPTSVQIGNAMEVTGKVGWSLTVEAAVHQHCQFELDPWQ